ncbi:MAG: hypothetical protein DRJ10_02105 [Bacteroidetes bacterium]|nr:MAG: hypothetical protein DRJ10_02105 [Bacteroidota bacterium]
MLLKKISLHIIYIVLFFVLDYSNVYSQNYDSKLAEEKIFLFTDRMMYIAGEQIHFTVFSTYSENGKHFEMSKVFYSELISPDGKRISGGKYLFEKSSGSGSLSIPKDIISGNYFIRAYTKYMRNNGPDSYYYIPLKIINPVYNQVIVNKNKSLLNKFSVIQDSAQMLPFSLSIEKKEYNTREKINISFKDFNLNKDSIKGLCLTVVPEASIFRQTIQSLNADNNTELIFYPETRGVTLTGKLVDRKSGKNLAYKTVNLSIMGDEKVFIPDITDSVGRFYFSLPEIYGKEDIFMSVGSFDGMETNILVDNDFCTKGVRLPSIAFDLNRKEKEVAYNFAVNHQIASHFKTNSIVTDTVINVEKSFYGSPSEILYLDNYIKLPSLEEYFTELPSVVKVRKRKGEKYLKIYSSIATMSVYEPLVLIDGVAIDNPEITLGIPPQRIQRIEVIDLPYIKGDLTYAGIISFISKKGDFAGVDLPKSGMFINYQFLDDICEYYEPDVLSKNRPDTRNTVFWKTDINLNDENANKLSFFTTDTPGKYIILVRGITFSGNILSSSITFTVKN